jgi:hypothetical protein
MTGFNALKINKIIFCNNLLEDNFIAIFADDAGNMCGASVGSFRIKG